MSVSLGVSGCWYTGVVFMQLGVNGAYYCDVFLLKTFLPDICQAAGDFCFPAHHTCARTLSCCDTRLRTSHQTWPLYRPDLSSVDYRLPSHSGMRLSETTRDVKHRWWAVVIQNDILLTEWHIIFHKVGPKHQSG